MLGNDDDEASSPLTAEEEERLDEELERAQQASQAVRGPGGGEPQAGGWWGAGREYEPGSSPSSSFERPLWFQQHPDAVAARTREGDLRLVGHRVLSELRPGEGTIEVFHAGK